ncbi:inositol monophosphatase [Bifidobacterium ramosum]|uniref:Inositol monophosphatase n=1 Tax=Bifidobacterium ramosum TaxID=1798158 RepID=A0A6L4X2F6_9BIFI|nr:inositol monophosphatase family protein [Bifidobacterium ramosum]KAB8288944.1 inositol monophosphatase [Bifidobacterium ramosum]NEG70661.1 inositol monophosphatase family protein [Bifidobacterium ramosum]
MELRELALEVARIAQDAGRHALTDQINPRDLKSLNLSPDKQSTLDVDDRLSRFIANRLSYIDNFNGQWQDRPEECHPGERYWCVGNIDGIINYSRNMPEWAITVSLFEFNEEGSAQPIVGVVHAPALGMTYLAARGQGAIRIRKTPIGDKREKIMPSTTAHLDGSVVSYGMSYVPEESKRALAVVSAIAGLPADIKRVGPASLDLCKVADGTYDAYFEPNLHKWDVPAVSAGAIVLWEAQAKLRTWNGGLVHWRRENDIVASNGLIIDELRPYLL